MVWEDLLLLLLLKTNLSGKATFNQSRMQLLEAKISNILWCDEREAWCLTVYSVQKAELLIPSCLFLRLSCVLHVMTGSSSFKLIRVECRRQLSLGLVNPFRTTFYCCNFLWIYQLLPFPLPNLTWIVQVSKDDRSDVESSSEEEDVTSNSTKGVFSTSSNGSNRINGHVAGGQWTEEE